MGSKIPNARLANKRIIDVLSYEKNPQGKVSCAINGCNAELSFVRRHPRKCASKTIEIPPCFRLKSNEHHAEGCKYNISGALNIIAKSSQSEVFRAISDKKYEFRLHVLIKSLRELTSLEVEKKTEGWGSGNESDKSYSNKGRLSNYLRTLKQIIELRTLCENNDELKSLIVLNFKGKKIPWSQFFFDNENLTNFIKYYGADKYTIPLAVSGLISKIVEPVEKYPYHVVELHSPFVKPDSKGLVKRNIVQIVVKKPEVVKSLIIGEEYVFFGQWSVNVKESKNKFGAINNTMVYQNIKIYISNSDHFVAC